MFSVIVISQVKKMKDSSYLILEKQDELAIKLFINLVIQC